MVDRAALEMRCTGNCTGGSNPSLSAINVGNQQITKQTPNFTPNNVKLGVFSLFKFSVLFLFSHIHYFKTKISQVLISPQEILGV